MVEEPSLFLDDYGDEALHNQTLHSILQYCIETGKQPPDEEVEMWDVTLEVGHEYYDLEKEMYDMDEDEAEKLANECARIMKQHNESLQRDIDRYPKSD